VASTTTFGIGSTLAIGGSVAMSGPVVLSLLRKKNAKRSNPTPRTPVAGAGAYKPDGATSLVY
jgi:hypothetical protein